MSGTLHGMEPVVERTLSDVLRTPKPVLEEAELHDVLIRRRGDAGDVMLIEAKRATALRDTLGMFARLLHAAWQVEGVEGHLVQGVNFTLPWTSFLPEDDRRQFMTELTETAGAAADTGNYAPLALLLRDWQATANVYADPAALKELTEPLEQSELQSLSAKPAKRRSRARSTTAKALPYLGKLRYGSQTVPASTSVIRTKPSPAQVAVGRAAARKAGVVPQPAKSANRRFATKRQRASSAGKGGAGSAK